MASVNFLYRSTKDNSPVSVRLLFRHNNKDFIIEAKTEFLPYSEDELEQYPVLTAKHYWQVIHKMKRVNDITIGSTTIDQNFIKNKRKEVINELTKIDALIITKFYNTSPVSINKEWLQSIISTYYTPNKEAPNDLLGYFDYYIKEQSKLKSGTIRKMVTVRNRIEKHLGNIQLSEIDDSYKSRVYTALSDYAANTIEGTIKVVKTICKHAIGNEVRVNKKVLRWKLSYDKSEIIYLSPDEIQAIQNLEGLPEHLDNARDWLLISCFTGQRVSDFLRFDKSMVKHERNKTGELTPMLKFTQKKTGKLMEIPINKEEILNILKKRNEGFPRPISDVKYNVYIKQVARRAKLTKPTKGSLRVKVAPHKYRHKVGIYPKWQLVSSHIGRRSFCTNNFGEIPTYLLMYASGHSRESTFLTYIGKTDNTKGHELAKYYK